MFRWRYFCVVIFPAFQPLSPTSNAPIPPPRRKHPQNLKLDRIKEGGSFDYSNTPPVDKKFYIDTQTKDQEFDTKSDTEEQAELDEMNKKPESPVVETVSTEQEQETKHEENAPVGRKLTKRTISLPLVKVPEDILSNNSLSEKSKSQSHEALVLQSSEESDMNLTSSIDSDHVKVIESEPESKSTKDTHHSRKISMKNIKKKFKQRNKRVKINEYSNKLVMDPNDPNSGPLSPLEKVENGKGSETDDNACTDDDLKSPTSVKSPNEVKSPAGMTSPTVDQEQKFEKEGGFLRRMSVKVKSLMTGHDHSDEEDDERKSLKKYKVTVIDLMEDNNNSKMVIHKMTLKELFQSQQGRSWYKHWSQSEKTQRHLGKQIVGYFMIIKG